MPPSQATELLDPTPPAPSRNPFAVGFRQPPPERDTSQTIPSPTTSPETLTEDEHAPGSGSVGQHDEPTESPAATSSPASTRVGNPLAGEGLKRMARNGVLIAGDQAHRFLARTHGQQQVGLYATDESDAAAIGDPLAEIAARREGLGEVSPDTADLLAAMMGLANYATKQIARNAEAKRLDAAYADDVQTLPDAGDLA